MKNKHNLYLDTTWDSYSTTIEISHALDDKTDLAMVAVIHLYKKGPVLVTLDIINKSGYIVTMICNSLDTMQDVKCHICRTLLLNVEQCALLYSMYILGADITTIYELIDSFLLQNN